MFSPEKILNFEQLDTHADIYAVGVIALSQ